jgi:hypothetical protein
MECFDRQMTRRQYLFLMAGTAASALAPGYCNAEDGKPVLRLAISQETLAGANINDARTAYKVWLREVKEQFGYVTAEPVPEIFIASEDLVRSVRQGTLDCYGMTLPTGSTMCCWCIGAAGSISLPIFGERRFCRTCIGTWFCCLPG